MNNPLVASRQPTLEASDSTKLTLLLRAVLCLNERNPIIPNYKESDHNELYEDRTVDCDVLDAVSAILVQQHEVVAASFYTPTRIVVAEDIKEECSSPVTAGFDNPLLKDSVLPQKVQVLGQGNNLWPTVRNSEWHCALMGPRPLPDHLATVCAYLNEYRRTELPRKRLSSIFNHYLVTTCRAKMHQRMTSWSVLGFMFNLDEIWEPKLQRILNFHVKWNEYPSSGPGDRTFLNYFRESSPDAGDRAIDEFSTRYPILRSMLALSKNPVKFIPRQPLSNFTD